MKIVASSWFYCSKWTNVTVASSGCPYSVPIMFQSSKIQFLIHFVVRYKISPLHDMVFVQNICFSQHNLYFFLKDEILIACHQKHFLNLRISIWVLIQPFTTRVTTLKHSILLYCCTFNISVFTAQPFHNPHGYPLTSRLYHRPWTMLSSTDE